MKKEIRIDELRVMMLDALALRGIGSEDADFIVDDFLDAELEGHKTHGVSKFLTIDIGLSGREGSIEIVSRTGGHAKIDGHRELGHIAARQAAALSAELAKEHGVGLVALTNVSRYARLVPYSRLIAERGCIGIVTNNGGPAHVVPFGGSAPMFGTNPLSFGFPQGEKPPLLFDFATAQGVWGELRQAIGRGAFPPREDFSRCCRRFHHRSTARAGRAPLWRGARRGTVHGARNSDRRVRRRKDGRRDPR